MAQLLAIADADNFYVSCERVFNPRLRNQPVIVLSNNDGNVVSRSNDIKPFIPMGAPVQTVKDVILKHNVAVFSSNFPLYGDLSRRLMDVMSQYSDQQEISSIDENFLSFSGIDNPIAHALAMKAEVHKCTGIPISIGMGSSKTLAKLASFCAKKREPWLNTRVCNLSDLNQLQFTTLLASIPVEEVWGIGSKLSYKLESQGVRTAQDLRVANPKALRMAFGVVMERIVAELNGHSCLSLEEIQPPKKQIIASRSFGQLITELPELEAAVAAHTRRSVDKLRAQGSLASILSVFIRTNPFRTQDAQYTGYLPVALVHATADIGILQAAANKALRQIFRPGYSYKKAGVMLAGIQDNSVGQADLFADAPDPRREQLNKVVDRINSMYGRGTLRTSTELMGRRWEMKQVRRSPRYTTCWNELPVVT